MTLSESQRLDLYERVKRSSLGEEGAHIMMNAIPAIDWTDLATHDDMSLVRSDLRNEMQVLRTDLRGEMQVLRSDLRSEMQVLRSDLQAEMGDLRSELRGEMGVLRAELKDEISELRVEIGALETRLQRSMVTWILAAQGVTLAALGILVTVLTLATA